MKLPSNKNIQESVPNQVCSLFLPQTTNPKQEMLRILNKNSQIRIKTMSHVTGTATIQVNQIELVQEDKYQVARGTAIFGGQAINIEAYGKAAQELNANQGSPITAECKIFGGSNQPRLKIERVISAAAPEVGTISPETVAQLKKVLTLKPKATKPVLADALAAANALLEGQVPRLEKAGLA